MRIVKADLLSVINMDEKLLNIYQRELASRKIYSSGKGCYINGKRVGIQKYNNQLKYIANLVYFQSFSAVKNGIDHYVISDNKVSNLTHVTPLQSEFRWPSDEEIEKAAEYYAAEFCQHSEDNLDEYDINERIGYEAGFEKAIKWLKRIQKPENEK